MDDREKVATQTSTTTVTAIGKQPARGREIVETARAATTKRSRAARPVLTAKEEQVLRMRYGISARADHELEFEGQDFEDTRLQLAEIEQRALEVIQSRMRGSKRPTSRKDKIIEKLRDL